MLKKLILLTGALLALTAAPALAQYAPPPAPTSSTTTTSSTSSTTSTSTPTTPTSTPGGGCSTVVKNISAEKSGTASIQINLQFDPNKSGVGEVRNVPGTAVRNGVPAGSVVDTFAFVTDAAGFATVISGPHSSGTYEISATVAPCTVTTRFTLNVGSTGVGAGGAGQGVGAGGSTRGGNLASTGSESIPLARLGVILMATGGLAVYAAKKRNGRRAAFSV